MNRVSVIGGLLKKIYRMYAQELLGQLQQKGFTDLGPSFLEVLLFISENEGPSIKQVGQGCGLKKQTMTSHLNELENRGYVERRLNPSDRREQKVHLTDYGEKFKLALMESVREIETNYEQLVGDVELDRIEHTLKTFYQRLDKKAGELDLGPAL
jgi:DNA-binding MarR family transcriptional regulator